MTTLADIFQQHGAKYLERYGAMMPPQQKKAIRDILTCRTAHLGGHTWLCKDCQKFHYNYSRPVGTKTEIVLSVKMKDVKNGWKNRLKNFCLSSISWQLLRFLKS